MDAGCGTVAFPLEVAQGFRYAGFVFLCPPSYRLTDAMLKDFGHGHTSAFVEEHSDTAVPGVWHIPFSLVTLC